jgi:hypothetical protein
MVLVSQGMPTGPLSDNSMERLKYVRYSVILLWLCGFSRMFVDNPFNGVATIFAAVCGTYTFMNDKFFTKCYEFMASNCVLCGPGGAQCMGPFMSISLINAIFDIFRFISLISGGVMLMVPLTSIAILLSIIIQVYAFAACLSVYKELVQPFDGPLPYDNRQPFIQSRSGYAPMQESMGGQGSGAGFVPFAGEGRRLG